MAIEGWRLLRSAPGARTMLAVDFTLAKVRAQANFGDLAPRLPDDCALWGSEESGWPWSAGRVSDQLDDWLRRGSGFAAVRAVLGFCASAALACALADRLADRPAVVLFDPVTVGPWTMLEQFAAAVERVGGTAGVEDAPTDPGDLATLLAARYSAAAGAAFAAQGIPDSITAQLCRRVGTNLRFLGMCAAAGLGAARPDLLVLSRDHVVPPPLLGVAQARLDVSQEELLGHPDAARVLLDAVAERR